MCCVDKHNPLLCKTRATLEKWCVLPCVHLGVTQTPNQGSLSLDLSLLPDDLTQLLNMGQEVFKEGITTLNGALLCVHFNLQQNDLEFIPHLFKDVRLGPHW